MADIKRAYDKYDNTSIMSIDYKLSLTLSENIRFFKQLFENDDTIVFREINNNHNTDFRSCLVFFDGMVNIDTLNENIIHPIMYAYLKGIRTDEVIEKLKEQMINANSISESDNFQEILEALFDGDSMLIIDGCDRVMLISSRGWSTRSISEPDYEKVISGPKEGFTESVMINLSLLRRRLKTPDLKIKYLNIGSKTHTKVYISYLNHVADEKILKELELRMEKIKDIDILDANYIQENIADSPYSPMRTIGNTERPDVVAGKLLEGRIAIFVDGTPEVLTIPFVFIENFQAPDDYYINFYFAGINRLIRILSGIMSISIPALYIALVTFHQEMIPTPLLLSISAARKGVPFPTIIEAIVILLAFEIVREAGTRMPTSMGQSISIVGALILGQASVEAKIFSAPIVIIGAVTGISGLLLPRLKGASIIFRVIFIFLASIIGLYGFIFGAMGLLIYLLSLRSFGITYMVKAGAINPKEIRDTAIRAPLLQLRHHYLLRNSRKSETGQLGKGK